MSYDSRIKSDLFARHRFRCVCGKRHCRAYISRAHAHPLPVLCGAGITLRGRLMVTASHNPSKYNGYKVYGADGCQITTEAAAAILAEIEKLDVFADVKRADFDASMEAGKIAWIGEDVTISFRGGCERAVCCWGMSRWTKMWPSCILR